MHKDRKFWIVVSILLLLLFGMLFSIEQSRTFLLALLVRMVLFTKQHILAILSAFFLVKGKFILSLFLKKIAILSATGLSKRYFIEKVLTHHIKIHFLDHIQDDLRRVTDYVKKNFRKFPIIKQIIAIIAFLSSLGFIGKFMGWMFALKVFVAKFWSFLLAIFLKMSTALVYFFTDYLWGSWIAPIVEVVIFSWLLEWLERVPALKSFFQKIYGVLATLLSSFEHFIEKIFHIPMKRFFAYLAKTVKHWIDTFMDEKKISSWFYLQEIRRLKPNKYRKMKFRQRENRLHSLRENEYISSYQKLIRKRLERTQ